MLCLTAPSHQADDHEVYNCVGQLHLFIVRFAFLSRPETPPFLFKSLRSPCSSGFCSRRACVTSSLVRRFLHFILKVAVRSPTLAQSIR
jgi:hypothetical protein